MMRGFLLAASVLTWASSAHAQEADQLTLSCAGTGSRLESHSTYAQVDGLGGSAFGSASSTDVAQSPERVTIQIEGPAGRIHLPTWLIPPVHGGSDGWFELTKVEVAPDTIRGSFGINFLNHPHFTIDRHTGEIDLSGFARLNFEGTCERGPDASSPTKF